MIYTELTKHAMRIAYRAHEGQIDKAGVPYIHHPLHVAESMKDEISVCTALLHDVCEDSEITIEDLRVQGIPEAVLEALILLTRDFRESYQSYIERVATNCLARQVKIADLLHNSDLSRLTYITERDRERVKKYKQALEFLDKLNKYSGTTPSMSMSL